MAREHIRRFNDLVGDDPTMQALAGIILGVAGAVVVAALAIVVVGIMQVL